MDITPTDTNQQHISDDQDLAQALAGVLPDAPEPVATIDDLPAPVEAPVQPAMQFEETPVPAPAPVHEHPHASAPAPAPAPVNNLDSIKREALSQLRPLVDRVELPPEEKFDTYLMLIRSTDDATLIGPAHAAAQGITDEKRRAEALLDVIKEIDYLSRNKDVAL